MQVHILVWLVAEAVCVAVKGGMSTDWSECEPYFVLGKASH